MGLLKADPYESTQDRIIIWLFMILLVVYVIAIFLGELFFLPKGFLKWCEENEDYSPLHYSNVDFDQNPCRFQRLSQLLFLTLEECDFCRRLVTAAVLGSIIGYERSKTNKQKLVKMMVVVALGSCMFTIAGMRAFTSTTQHWDASRVTADLPKAVGFLGGASIWKGTIGSSPNEKHEVHGITTAASVWLTCSVGAGCGGHCYVTVWFLVACMVIVLRYGPRLQQAHFYEQNENHQKKFNPSSVHAAKAKNEMLRKRKMGVNESSKEAALMSSIRVDDKMASDVSFLRDVSLLSMPSFHSLSRSQSLHSKDGSFVTFAPRVETLEFRNEKDSEIH